MNKIFKNIKKESVITVYNQALENVKSSRTDLSRETGLSFVTTGKIVDGLVELKILRQTYTRDPSQSRKSRLLFTKFHYWIGVYTIEKNVFTFNICDLSLRCKHTYKYIPERTVFLDDNIKRFLYLSKKFADDNMKMHPCCGIGILTDGDYDIETDKVYNSTIAHMSSVKIKEMFSPFSFGTDPLIMSVYDAFSGEIRRSLCENEYAYCIFLNKNRILSTYIYPSDTQKTPVTHLGELEGIRSATLDDNVKLPPEPDSFFSRLADIIFTMTHTVPITKVIVSGGLYERISSVSTYLYKNLADRFNSLYKMPPNVEGSDIRTPSIRYISREMRDRWFVNTVLEEDTP